MDEVVSELRVRYVETDQMGIVHHSVYFHWMEVGRTDYLRKKGFPYSKMEESGIRMPLIEASAKYVSPAKYDDEILVITKLEEFSPIKFSFSYKIVRKSNSKLIAEGITKHIAADCQNKPKRVPKEILSIIGG
ncbi:MAG: acyl-CoA thioesterase [Thermoanaerobaculaceae bacterium]|nr:acyl-CoA thioesterase [Thermoanaerobaculaceae bacterium]